MDTRPNLYIIPRFLCVPLEQGSSNLILEGWCPAEFSSNLSQHTCLEVSSIPSKSLISCFRCVWLGLELNSAGHRPSRTELGDPCTRGSSCNVTTNGTRTTLWEPLLYRIPAEKYGSYLTKRFVLFKEKYTFIYFLTTNAQLALARPHAFRNHAHVT